MDSQEIFKVVEGAPDYEVMAQARTGRTWRHL